MAIKSGFFNSVNGDRKYDASRFAEYFATFIGNGVFPNPSDNLQIISNNDMTVTIRPGKAWINGYILINDDDYILELGSADGVLNRVDRVVARYDVVNREIRIEVKKGELASTPVAPVLQRDVDAYELGLADIYVGKGVISISQANITDLRLNSDLCGIVHGTVDQVDTTTLFNQFESQFESWFESLKDVLDEETAGNLYNLIEKMQNDITLTSEDLDTLENNFDVSIREQREKLAEVEQTALERVGQTFSELILYVSKSGNDATADGSTSKPFRTAQAALDSAPKLLNHNLRIRYMQAGDFLENLEVTGFNGGGVIYLEMASGVSGRAILNSVYFRGNPASVYMSGLSFHGTETAVSGSGVSDIHINNSLVDANGTTGVYASRNSYIRITNCDIGFKTNAVLAESGGTISVQDSRGTQNSRGYHAYRGGIIGVHVGNTLQGDSLYHATAGGVIIRGGTVLNG